MRNLYLVICSLFFLGIGTTQAQITTLHTFYDSGSIGNANGSYPEGNLTPSVSKKVLYGMTYYAGAINNNGMIFCIDSNGNNFRDLFDFNETDGAYPFGSLTLEGGVMFGMTGFGGTDGEGCVFKVDTNGSNYKVLLNFNSVNGKNPYGALTLSANGKVLYGMTSTGAAHIDGNVFKIDTDGTQFKDLLDFNGTNGNEPYGSLVLAKNVLYGMTSLGGADNHGLIFSVDTNGAGYKDMNDFNGTNGEDPNGTMLLVGGVLYGTTLSGGANGDANIFKIDTDGTGYKDIYDFSYATGAYSEYGTLLLTGHVFYGMAKGGGANGDGVIYKVDTNGSNYKDLLDFNGTNGYLPYASLILLKNLLYGMTSEGGSDDVGIIFSFDTNNVSTSVNQLSVVSGQWSVYPNPSTGIFTISQVGAKKISPATIEIFNVLGEKVYSQLTICNSQLTIDLRSKSNGVYFYRILGDDAAVIGEGKMVIQK